MLGYHSEIKQPSTSVESLKGAAGIIFSDGPGLGFAKTKNNLNEEILSLEIPILGIGYGHQLLVHLYGGLVGKALIGEFGPALLNQNLATYSPLLLDVEETASVVMAHQDEVLELPQGFEVVASTKVCKYAAVQDLNQGRFGFQCNIEAKETECGTAILENFVRFYGMEKNWDQDIVLELMQAKIRFTAKDKKVQIFLSGGVDSTVAFTLLNKSLGQKRVLGIHIDNGFLRKNESKAIATRYRDEVRELGRKMGLQDEMAHRHPFPEPGLAINVLCSTGELSYREQSQLSQTQVKVLNLINKEGLDQTREADAIVLEEIKRFGWYEEIFQHLTMNLPYASCPDHCSIVLRPVDSEDVITGKFSHMHHQVLDAIMERLVQLPFVDAIYYDITNKPPAKFFWAKFSKKYPPFGGYFHFKF